MEERQGDDICARGLEDNVWNGNRRGDIQVKVHETGLYGPFRSKGDLGIDGMTGATARLSESYFSFLRNTPKEK